MLVFHASAVTQVSISRAGEVPSVHPAVPGQFSVAVTVDVEDNDAFDVRLLDATGSVIGEWTLLVTVRDVSDVANSPLDALIREHRMRRRCVPHAPDTPLHRLELGSYLNSADSWKPVLACWTSHGAGVRAVDWNGARLLGDVQPQIDRAQRSRRQPPWSQPAMQYARCSTRSNVAYPRSK